MLSKIKVSDYQNFEEAAKASDVIVTEKTQFGKTAVVVVKYKHAQQLFDLGVFSSMKAEEKPEPKQYAIEPTAETVKEAEKTEAEKIQPKKK